MLVDHQVITLDPPRAATTPAEAVTSPVVHLVMHEGLSSVFEAMVATPLGLLAERNLDVRLVVFSRLGEFIRQGPRDQWRKRLAAVRSVYKGPLDRLASPPARASWLWNEASIFKRWMERNIGANHPAIVHCRGPIAVDVALRARRFMPRLKVIFDMRGLVDAEYLCEQGRQARDVEYHRLARIQQRAAQNADGMFCVSNAMADYAIESLGAQPDKVTVLPCAVQLGSTEQMETHRRSMRQHLKLENRFVVAFSGGAQQWQQPHRAAGVFQLVKRARPDAHLLILTLNQDAMKSVMESCGIDRNDMTILTAAHAEVPEYLAAADLGLLVRDRSIVNAVASPVKFAEYLAAGVPVAISQGLGDFSDMVRDHRIGVVLSDDESEAAEALRVFVQSRDFDFMRMRCRRAAQDELNLDRNVERTIQVYSQLCLESCESCT